MDVEIYGNKIDLGDSLVETVEEKLIEGVTKYSENPISAQVNFSKSGHEFVCDLTVHLSTGLVANAKGRDAEIYASADDAMERMEKQLRRYKRRLKNHHKSRQSPIEAFAEAAYVIEASPEDESAVDEATEMQPVIIAETEVRVQNLSVGEAVMQMELGDNAMLVFRNSDHGGVNVVFRRDDGNIGWIDPRRS